MCFCKLGGLWNVLPVRVQQSKASRDEESPTRIREQGTTPVGGAPGRAPPPETPPPEKVLHRVLVPERHRPKERQEEHQYEERTPRDVSLDVEVIPKRTPRSPTRESRDIIGLVDGAPKGALVSEVPSVEEVLKRVQAPAPAPRRDARLRA